MRRFAAVAVLVACGDAKPAAPVVSSEPEVVRPTCRPIQEAAFAPKMPDVASVAWLTPTSFVAAIRDRANPAESGIAIYDSQAKTRRLFRMPAKAIAVRDPRTLLVVQDDGVAVFDLEASCARESERLAIVHVAIDAVRGRFFVHTKTGFLRLDELAVKADVPAPRNIKAMAYDAASDRVIVRTYSPKVELFDAELRPAGTIELPVEPRTGPWVRRGEVWLTFDVHCKRREFDHLPARKNLGKCLDDPKTVGTFLRRHELPSGRLVETVHFMDGDSMMGEDTSTVGFSGDQKVMMASAVFEAHLLVIGGASTLFNHGHTHAWGNGRSFPIPMALDETGARFVGTGGFHEIGIVETKTGKDLWSMPMPRGDPYAP